MNCEPDNLTSKGTIVFLAVNASYSHTNLAGWYLHGIAESAGWNWQEEEIIQNESLASALQRVLRLNPDIIAASFYLFNSSFLLSFLSRFKAIRKNCLVIGGGPEFLGDNFSFLEHHPEINAVIRGEGEQAFADWLECWQKPEEWEKIKGLCAIIDGNYIDNGKAELITDLDEIPSPFRGNLSGFRKPFLLLETSRGCSNKCAFCTSAGEHVRFFSLARVRSDLVLAAAAGVKEIRLVDRTFNENPKRSLELLKIMRDEFPEIKFHLEIDPARLSEEMIKGLSLAADGMLHLEVGLQTMRADTLKALGRFGSIEQSLANLKRLCRMKNLAIHVDLIAGLPEATLKDLYHDLDALALMEPAEIQLELLKVLPGTRLSREKEKSGIIAAGEPPYEVLQTANMSSDDLVIAQRLSNLIDWFYNTPELQPSVIAAVKLVPAFFERFNDFGGKIAGESHAPALENRFRLLEQFYRLNEPVLIPKLGYAWLKCGLSAQHGICPAKPWKKSLPAGAILVEGDDQATPARSRCAPGAAGGPARNGYAHSVAGGPRRIYLAELDRQYLFVYGKCLSRRATAIYAL